ncbi:MAG: cupin domain-containing protein [Alphaproteobacteria bacterium]|nr:cupin domain-containing protein [Alphaproteobacteria bacterium]
MKRALLVAAVLAFTSGPALAQTFEWSPERQALENAFTGPKAGKAISNKVLGEFDMTNEIPGMDGRFMRLRYWTIQPGGVVPVHSHANRPGLIYILGGEILEHRSDRAEPKVHGPGTISLENDGISHWWSNEGDTPVTLLGFDVFQR